MIEFDKAYGDCIGPLDFPMKDADAKQLEMDLESGEYSPLRLVKSNAFEAFIPGEKADISVISDGSIDSHGEVVDPESLDFSSFQKNPVVAYNHNYDIPPVGKSLWQKKCQGHVWKAKTKYVERPESFTEDAWFPETIWHLVKSGTLNGKSIGGSVKWRSPTEEDAKRLNFDLSSAKRISEKALIFEYSCCPLGVNRNTVVEAIAKSVISIPDNILKSDFPDVFTALQTIQKEEDSKFHISKKSFITREEYAEQRRIFLKAKISEVKNSIPNLVEETFKRLTGKVS